MEQIYDPGAAAEADWAGPIRYLCQNQPPCSAKRAGPYRVLVTVPLPALNVGRSPHFPSTLPSVTPSYQKWLHSCQ